MRRSAYLSDRQLSRKRDGKHQTVEPVLAFSHNVRHLQTNERQNTLVLTSVVVYTRIYRALRKYSHPRPSLTVCTFCHVTPRNGESFNSFFLNAKYMARLWLLLEETYLAKIKAEVKRRLIREATKAPMVNAEYDAATTIYFNTDLVISHSCGVFFLSFTFITDISDYPLLWLRSYGGTDSEWHFVVFKRSPERFVSLNSRHSPVWRNSDRRSAAAPRHTPHTPLTAPSAPGHRPRSRSLQVTPASFSYTEGRPSLSLLRHHGIARHHPYRGTLKALSLCPTEQYGETDTDAKRIARGTVWHVIFKRMTDDSEEDMEHSGLHTYTPHRTADMKNTFPHNRIGGRIFRSSQRPTASWWPHGLYL